MPKTNVHPTVTALETVMEALAAAQSRIHSSDWAERAAAQIDPTRWTQRIEEAIGKPEELERLRVLFDEEALSFMTAWLTDQSYYEDYHQANRVIWQSISDVLVACEAIDDRSPDRWLKDIMRNRIVEADAIRHQRFDDRRIDDRNSAVTLAYGVLVKAFAVVEQYNSRRGSVSAYTTDLVTPGRKYESHLNPDVDLRRVRFVDFVDCVNSKHPASEKLAALMKQLEEVRQAAHLAESRLKGDMNPYDKQRSEVHNGTVNERPHAFRLVGLLHGESLGCGSVADALSAQNTTRRQYEAVRQELSIGIRQLQNMRDDLAQTLYAAVVETQQLLQETQQDRATTIDRWKTVRICLNNCLAADLRLRELGREIEKLQAVYRKDMSSGQGARALQASFEAAAQHYRPFRTVAGGESGQ